MFLHQTFERFNQDWNDLNQLIKINDLNRDLNQMIFFCKKIGFDQRMKACKHLNNPVNDEEINVNDFIYDSFIVSWHCTNF